MDAREQSLAKIKGATTTEHLLENLKVEPTLNQPESTGVVALAVPSEAAARAAQFLQQHWHDGKLQLGHGYALGYNLYGKTLEEHDSVKQKENTLLLKRSYLDPVRRHLPGFKEMEEHLISQLQARRHPRQCPLHRCCHRTHRTHHMLVGCRSDIVSS